MPVLLRAALIASLVSAATGCRCAGESPPTEAAPSASSVATAATEVATPVEELDLLENLDTCEIWHRGLSIDFGTDASLPLRGFSVGPFAAEISERGGSSFERVKGKKLEHSFWLHADRNDELFVSFRVHGGVANRVYGYIDGRSIGGAKLTPGTTEVIEFRTVPFKLDQGRHTLLLRFRGRLVGSNDAYAEVDWVRIGLRDELPATYAAPTLRDIVSDFELGGTPHRSLVLRAPSTIRCPLHPTRDARFRVALGYWGEGRGTAEIRVVQDGQEPITLQQRNVVGGEGGQWVPLDIDLSKYAGEVVGIELRALESRGGGRVVFGEPRLGSKRRTEPTVPRARTVLVVVEAALDRRRIPPWGPIGELTALGELVRSGVAFSAYRAPATITTATFATLLTGLSPRAHAAEDQAARLPDQVRTANEIMKAAGCRTAYFTSVPTTSAAFGFNVGWDRYEYYSPVKDVAAVEPFEAAARFIEQDVQQSPDGQRFILIHARGAHPPWDLTKQEVSELPPEEYGGAIDARRGGITLGKIRARRARAWRRLTAEEWTRLHALEDATMAKQAQALARVFSVMKREGIWEDALVVFMGDVAVGDPPRVPYHPAGDLTEDRLAVPLLARFPGNALAGREAQVPVTTIDFAPTVLRALRLDVPEQMRGRDLFTSASGFEPTAGRLLVATGEQRYSARLGNWLLTGKHGQVPRLCRLDVDPACVNDQFDERPIVGQALWRWTFLEEYRFASGEGRVAEREPASIDPEVAAALIVWGDIR
jgi:arylsulfatase A-like enzyme